MNYWKLVLGTEGTQSDVLEPDADDLLRIIAWASGLGFSSMELWISSDDHLSDLLKGELARVRSACVDGAISADYLSCDFTARWFLTKPTQFVEKYFGRIASFARVLDIKTIASVSPPLPAAATEWSHVYPGAPPKEVKLLSGFSWDKSWARYVERISSVAKILGKHSLNLAVEPRAKEMLANTDAVVRLTDRVGAENLGGLIDTGHLQIIREVPAVSINKLGKKLFEFQASENDGITAYHWAPGQGELNWRETLEALRNVGFSGPVCIDVTGINMEKEILDGKVYIEELMRRLDLQSDSRQQVRPVRARPRDGPR